MRFARSPTKKVFPVEHFGVDLRGESGSPCAPPGPIFSSGAAARRGGAPRGARARKFGPQLVVWASSVHAHRLALALASGQELRAWGSAKRQSVPWGRTARPVGQVGGGRGGPGLAAVLEAVWQGVVELGHGAVQGGAA